LRERTPDDPKRSGPRRPDGVDENDNVELRRWWPGMDEGRHSLNSPITRRFLTGTPRSELGILDLEAGARIAGSDVPLFRGAGSRLIRSLSALSLDRNAGVYEESIRRPSR